MSGCCEYLREAGDNPTLPREFAFPPPRPPIFFGRDDLVQKIVNIILQGDHVTLIGTGGMGKSSIAKAILNETSIRSAFVARLFISYDSISISVMSFEKFLEQIGEALGLATWKEKDVLRRLESVSALLVIDNAETFLGAPAEDQARISAMLDTMGARPSTRIILTTRNQEAIPSNIICHRVPVRGLSLEAACEAFSAVYKRGPINEDIQDVLAALDYHPLSINILACSATMNDWTPAELLAKWQERQSHVLHIADDKYRSLRVTIELSLAALRDRNDSLALLRAIAFLPQGIHKDDVHAIASTGSSNMGSQSSPDLLVESLLRASLIHRSGDRLAMLAPIRMHITDRYNHTMHYNDPILLSLRSHYRYMLRRTPQQCVIREHSNFDRLLYFDLTSLLYKTDLKTQLFTLEIVAEFFQRLQHFNPQMTSLWPLLVSEVTAYSKSSNTSLTFVLGNCLQWACWLEYQRDRKALLAVPIAERFLRENTPICNKSLFSCLRVKGFIHMHHGNIFLAEEVVHEGLAITDSIHHSYRKASDNELLSMVALYRGNFSDASGLAGVAEKVFEQNTDYGNLVHLFLTRTLITVQENDFVRARHFADKAMMVDSHHSGNRRRFLILITKGNIEGWAGDVKAAYIYLNQVLETDHHPGMPHFDVFLEALRGKAIYEASLGHLESAQMLLTRAVEFTSKVGGEHNHLYTSLARVYVDLSSREAHRPRLLLEEQLKHVESENLIALARLRRSLGEVALLEGDKIEANTQFHEVLSLCNAMGIQPKLLYANEWHWNTFPGEFFGWASFLDDM